MDILDLEEQLYKKTKLLISKMEKDIKSKDEEITYTRKKSSSHLGKIIYPD